MTSLKTAALKIKVCGMREEKNLADLSRLSPDFIGFIFYDRSPRYAENLSASRVHSLPQEIKRVGVFVDATTEEILERVHRYDLDLIQLHGEETPQNVETLRDRFEGEIIKAFQVSDTFDFSRLHAYQPLVDFVLLDTSVKSKPNTTSSTDSNTQERETNGEKKGGTGVKFDWSLLNRYPLETPLFLSGGIGVHDANQIRELSQKIPLYGIDLNSRFETSAGVKNIEALSRFFEEVRQPYE